MTNIFVSLPVQDLKKSKAFFSALGLGFKIIYMDHAFVQKT